MAVEREARKRAFENSPTLVNGRFQFPALVVVGCRLERKRVCKLRKIELVWRAGDSESVKWKRSPQGTSWRAYVRSVSPWGICMEAEEQIVIYTDWRKGWKNMRRSPLAIMKRKKNSLWYRKFIRPCNRKRKGTQSGMGCSRQRTLWPSIQRIYSSWRPAFGSVKDDLIGKK